MNILKYFEILKVVADDVVPVSNQRLAAMVVHRNRIISIGFNQNKSHPFAAKYSKHPEAYFLHAETDAILKAKKKLSEAEFRRATLIIARVKEDNIGNEHFGISKPCSGCAKCIEEHGIRTVIYTIESEAKKVKWITEQSS